MSEFLTESSYFFTTVGNFDAYLVDLCKKANIEFINRKYTDIHEDLSEHYDIHRTNEYRKLSQKFCNEFIEEFSANDLRIWYECTHRLVFMKKALTMKYYNQLKIYDAFVRKWMQENNFKYKIDAFAMGGNIKKAYAELGIGFDDSDFAQEYLMQLWGIIKTIRESDYDITLIKTLKSFIIDLLYFCGNKYYTTQDLCDRKVLKDLYYELCETIETSDGYHGHDLFYDYDGYGNTISAIDGKQVKREW